MLLYIYITLSVTAVLQEFVQIEGFSGTQFD